MQIQPKISPWIGRWLTGIALLIAAMVVVGGATRLTGSGLSITEWAPILGTIPPLSDADWQTAFAKYQQSSQFKLQNSTMSLPDFHYIFWWEWAHRFLGRFIGFAVAIPLAFFAWRKMLPNGMWPKVLIMLALGAGQGALGWYMVASGLVDRVSVTQYRLAAHLTLATAIFAYVVWVRLSLTEKPQPRFGFAALILGLVFVQVAAGGFVAGLDAGQGYNTWPMMDGGVIPHGLFAMQPWWLNAFENALTVQFNHRLLAYIILGLALWQAAVTTGRAPQLLVLAILCQASLGIATLLWHVPLYLALAHQFGALIVLLAAVYNLQQCSAERTPIKILVNNPR